VVGPSTTELESINELIKFDHIYYKIEPATDIADSEVVIDTENESLCENETDDIENLINYQSIPSEIIQSEINSENICEDSDVSQKDECPVIGECDIPEINMELLKDIENLIEMDLQNQLCQDSQDTVSQKELSLADDTCKTDYLVTNTKISNKKRKCTNIQSPTQSLEVTDTFSWDNSYLETFSDSGVSSDYSEAGSPCSAISSGLTEDRWEESFMELFPDLA